MPSISTRRSFLTATAAAAAAALTARGVSAEPELAPEDHPLNALIGFSKPFQQLNPVETARFVADVGWDGIECPVRSKGQIEPEQVDDALPSLIDALRAKGLSIPLAATDILRIDQPHAEKTLRALAKAGVGGIRLGFYHYDLKGDLHAQLAETRDKLRDIASACTELGIKAGFQNHSGGDIIGAPVWDVVGLIREINSPTLGLCFDIGHATVEGGLSWPIEARLAEPHLQTVIVKDFVWKKQLRRWSESWCPLGEGMVNPNYFTRLSRIKFSGPICQHHEYELGDLMQMKAHMKRDLEVLRSWIC